MKCRRAFSGSLACSASSSLVLSRPSAWILALILAAQQRHGPGLDIRPGHLQFFRVAAQRGFHPAQFHVHILPAVVVTHQAGQALVQIGEATQCPTAKNVTSADAPTRFFSMSRIVVMACSMASMRSARAAELRRALMSEG